jgi:hypothetical protein
MKISPVLKLAESLSYDGFTPSKIKTNSIYTVATGEEKEVPPDVYDALSFLEGFMDRLWGKITSN